MKAVIDSVKGDYFRCLIENGDVLNVHNSELDADAKIGDLVEVKIKLEKTDK